MKSLLFPIALILALSLNPYMDAIGIVQERKSIPGEERSLNSSETMVLLEGNSRYETMFDISDQGNGVLTFEKNSLSDHDTIIWVLDPIEE
jgi:hypothetical protein